MKPLCLIAQILWVVGIGMVLWSAQSFWRHNTFTKKTKHSLMFCNFVKGCINGTAFTKKRKKNFYPTHKWNLKWQQWERNCLHILLVTRLWNWRIWFHHCKQLIKKHTPTALYWKLVLSGPSEWNITFLKVFEVVLYKVLFRFLYAKISNCPYFSPFQFSHHFALLLGCAQHITKKCTMRWHELHHIFSSLSFQSTPDRRGLEK